MASNQGMVDTITAIMVEVLNFIGIATRKSSKAEQVRVSFTNQVPTDKAICREVFKETDRKERYRGCAEETRQADTRGGSNGCCATPEGHEYDR